jgi:hypothetical protein
MDYPLIHIPLTSLPSFNKNIVNDYGSRKSGYFSGSRR